jgi:DNA-binding IscR family transcriptional regulator
VIKSSSCSGITVADVAEAVEAPGALFQRMEIRPRGPVPLAGAACRTPCGIARLMATSLAARDVRLVAGSAGCPNTAGTTG